MKEAVLGVDIGGVIIDRINDDTDTSFFGDNYLKTTAVPEAFDALYLLNRARFQGRIHLVSKAGEKIEARSREWLAHHRFFELTGIPAANLHFCRTRPEKAPICAELEVTHFIDDKPEVIQYLLGIVEHRFLFRPQLKELKEYQRTVILTSQVAVSESWTRLAAALLTRY